jgi:hypothetical protein
MNKTQEFIPIESIDADLVFLKDGSITAVIQTSAVNFGLLSEVEQVAIIDSFAGLLNSLSFAIQIVIRSERLDVSSYLTTLDKALKFQTNPLLARMISRYRAFVESMIKENDVLDKKFYIAVNISSLEMGLVSKSHQDKISKALTVLYPRVDHLIRQLARIGLKARRLSTAELVKLYYDIYNDISFEGAPLVQAAGQTLAPTAPTQPSQAQTLPISIPRAPQPMVFQPNPTPPPAQPYYNSSVNAPPHQPTQTAPQFVVEELHD